MQTERLTLSTPELRPGDVVHVHGMRCLIDRDILPSKRHAGNTTFYTDTLVLNRDDVPTRVVPMSFTSTADRPARGMPAEPAGTHRWTIQGNELARWSVDRDPNYGRQSAGPLARGPMGDAMRALDRG